MPESFAGTPLLTLAIPTYNRSTELHAMLAVLLPQLAGHGEIDLYISDNGSTDDTEAMVRRLQAAGAAIRYERQSENIGSDRNFVHCFEHARGRYFWLCGDDDVVCPGTIAKLLRHIGDEAEVDLVYLTSYAFREDFVAERQEDKLGRSFQVFTDAFEFAKVVNIMFTFISGIVVNRERLLSLPHEPPSALLDTNLTQLSWSLPLLLQHRRSVVVWDRALAGQVGNAGGYALGRVFGRGLRDVVERLLPGRCDLQGAILNFTLRRWLPQAILDTRVSRNEKLGLATARQDFHQAYASNFRWWLFGYPVLRLPLPLAKVWLKGGKALSMLIYMLTVPRFWRKEN